MNTTAPVRLATILLEFTLPKPPPSRCMCGHTRIQHPAANRCRLCRCSGFTNDPNGPSPGGRPDSEPSVEPVKPLSDGQGAVRPPTKLQMQRARRNALIRRQARRGVPRADIAAALGITVRTVERVLSPTYARRVA